MSLSEAPRRPDRVDLAALLALVAGLAAAAVVWRLGPPGLLPTHLNFQGRVDGWSSRTGVAAMMAGTTVLFGVIYLLIGAVTLGADAAARPDAA